LQVAKVKRLFNMEPEKEQKRDAAAVHEAMRPREEALDSERAPNSNAKHGQAELPADPNPLKQDNPKRLPTANESKGEKTTSMIPSRPPLPDAGTELELAAGAFKQTLLKTWKPAGELAPRGTFFISGLFEIRGPDASCILEVIATYHPVDRTWASMGWKVRRIRLQSQPPKGGP
jgi:hypothetical protein